MKKKKKVNQILNNLILTIKFTTTILEFDDRYVGYGKLFIIAHKKAFPSWTNKSGSRSRRMITRNNVIYAEGVLLNKMKN